MASVTKDLPPLPPNGGPSTPFAGAESAPKHPGLFKRLTTKLRKPSESWGQDGFDASQDDSAHRGKARRQFASRKVSAHTTPGLENAFIDPEQRLAALRERGLLPSQAAPFKDSHGFRLPLSEQEEQLDGRDSVKVDVPRQSDERESEAGKIAEAWMKKNLGETYQPGSRSSGRPSNEEAPPQLPTVEESPAQVSTPLQTEAPAGFGSASQSRPAFLNREPQATKLLEAMKNYRAPAVRSSSSHPRRYPADSGSSSDSTSD